MRYIQLIFCFFLMISMNAVAQEADASMNVKAYFDVNGTTAQYESAYDELLKMLASTYPKSENNKDGWNYLETNKGAAIEEMKSLLSPLYQEHYTPEDIEKMMRFYQGDTGKQLRSDRSQMTEKQNAEFHTFLSSEIGKKIIEKQTVLGQEISKISEAWSRDLYETALSLLKN